MDARETKGRLRYRPTSSIYTMTSRAVPPFSGPGSWLCQSGYDAEMEEGGEEEEEKEEEREEEEREEEEREGAATQVPEALHTGSSFETRHQELVLRLRAIEERQDRTDAFIARMWEGRCPSEGDAVRSRTQRTSNANSDGPTSALGHGSGVEGGQRGKDSSGNYVRRCVRQHVEESFGIKACGGNPPPPPTPDEQAAILRGIAAGGTLQKPFLYDWRSHPTTDYNVRQKWLKAQRTPPTAAQRIAAAKHNTRNSRVGTTFRNRRAACEQLLDKALGAQVVAVINAIGTRGISSDEEMPVPSGHGKQFATFDKPWRAQALEPQRQPDTHEASHLSYQGEHVVAIPSILRAMVDDCVTTGLMLWNIVWDAMVHARAHAVQTVALAVITFVIHDSTARTPSRSPE
ncbi:hypothetical protein VTO73DRAFT_13119 [Trametes versicolor]